jgi:DNA-directed RNA polymerase specialized sigma24 family protein
MVERLGYTVAQAAQMLGLDRAAAHKKYWQARQKIRPSQVLRDVLLERSPELLPRDLCALELIEVLNYSIGRAAKILGVNKGHLCRRIAIAREIIKRAGDPRVSTN